MQTNNRINVEISRMPIDNDMSKIMTDAEKKYSSHLCTRTEETDSLPSVRDREILNKMELG